MKRVGLGKRVEEDGEERNDNMENMNWRKKKEIKTTKRVRSPAMNYNTYFLINTSRGHPTRTPRILE